MYWAQLKYDSHKWIEYPKGYYKCEFCDSIHTSVRTVDTVNICKKNPNLFPTDNQTPNQKTMNQTFEQLKEQVLQWAVNRNLLQISNHPVQFIKVVEELGELGSAILKSNRQAEYDGFGDVLVTLIILAEQRGVDIVKALETAYEEIMNRRGSTVNGIFVKKSDS